MINFHARPVGVRHSEGPPFRNGAIPRGSHPLTPEARLTPTYYETSTKSATEVALAVQEDSEEYEMEKQAVEEVQAISIRKELWDL